MIDGIANLGLLALLFGVALVMLYARAPLVLIILSGIYSLVICGLFVVLDAVDVALTEAAVGAGIAGVLFLSVVRPGDGERVAFAWPGAKALALGVTIALLALMGTLDMPLAGDPDAPAHRHLATRFLEQSWREIGIPNVVTSVLASYRGYDTLGEVVVIFTAGVAAYILLAGTGGGGGGSAPTPRELARNPVIRMVLVRAIPLVLLFALYVQFHGEYSPGGGFQAGAIFGAGLITLGLMTSARRLKAVVSEKVALWGMALGVLLYGLVGVVSLLRGGAYLDYSVLGATQTGGQHLGILVIEFGVGLTVACTMLSLYFSFNRDAAS